MPPIRSMGRATCHPLRGDLIGSSQPCSTRVAIAARQGLERRRDEEQQGRSSAMLGRTAAGKSAATFPFAWIEKARDR